MAEKNLNSADLNCAFCNYNNQAFPHYERYGQDNLSRFVVAETDNFLVKPDILPGNSDGRHVLVHPKRHVYNHAGLVGHSDEVGRLTYDLEQKFGPLVVFEHGGLQPGNNVQSVYHAHFHAYGGLEKVDVIAWMQYMLNGGLGSDEIYPYDIIPAPDFAFITNLSGRFNGIPYLYVEQGPWGLIVEDCEERMRSQITQRSMHLLFSGEVLDWKKIPESELLARESVRRIRNLIDFCQHGEYNAHTF